VRTVRRMCNEGTLAHTRNPGTNSHLRIHADSLMEYLEQGVVA